MQLVTESIFITREKMKTFKETIHAYYALNKRPFPWRDTENPYHVLVSEIMLQQTQTYRVEPKFLNFISLFPTIQSLACAPLATVLMAWQGLGYNRRAKFLHQTAQEIVANHNATVPENPLDLQKLPGIGYATACSIAAFAYNKPTAFIETNIRAVFIHFFFTAADDVHDAQLIPLVEQALEGEDPRQWYYALMDYGVMLKKVHKNPSRCSKHHVVQSKFEGSDRQIRGAIIRVLTQYGVLPYEELLTLVQTDIGRAEAEKKLAIIFDQLVRENMVKISELGVVSLS